MQNRVKHLSYVCEIYPCVGMDGGCGDWRMKGDSVVVQRVAEAFMFDNI